MTTLIHLGNTVGGKIRHIAGFMAWREQDNRSNALQYFCYLCADVRLWPLFNNLT
jgi:hypothetical protein